MPASFDFGAIFAPGAHIDFFYPFALSKETNRWGNTLALVGRLKPDAHLPRAQAEADILGDQIPAEHPNENDIHPKLTFLREHVSGRLRPALWILACAVGVVMLIVCANSVQPDVGAHRGTSKGNGHTRRARRRPQTVDSPIADRESAADRLRRHIGLVLTFAATRGIAHLTAFNLPLLSSVHVDRGVLAFTVLIAVATGLMLGVAPALQISVLRLKRLARAARRQRRQGPCLAAWRSRDLGNCIRVRAAGGRGPAHP